MGTVRPQLLTTSYPTPGFMLDHKIEKSAKSISLVIAVEEYTDEEEREIWMK